MYFSPLEDALRRFGKREFRPMQRELMECALRGRSCIGILPTGSGKSLCYQIPAVLMDGVAVVVSPLIALMRDQVSGLEKLGVAAARYDSSLSDEENGSCILTGSSTCKSRPTTGKKDCGTRAFPFPLPCVISYVIFTPFEAGNRMRI